MTTAQTDAPVLRLPVVTVIVLVLLAIVFAFEVRFAPVLQGGLSPPVGALIAYGAADGALVFGHGEWWRVFTAPMLHANLSHLLSNAAVFAIVGFMLEPLVGSRWFAALYAVGGLGGALCALLLDPPDIPAVGASGAIMGVLGAAFLCGASAKAGPKGRRMQSWSLRMMLP
ncbi:MAG TPA: rhomboid family intramembrane serine protease, partial [Rhizomicrobium sp.]